MGKMIENLPDVNYNNSPSGTTKKNEILVDVSPRMKKELEDQFKSEYEAAETHIAPKREKFYDRLRLYNNSQRAPDKVGDPTMFTVMQTIIAYVQEDRLQISFGQSTNAKNRELVAESDYDETNKMLMDYYWNWNTFFYGRACVMMMEYDRKKLLNRPKLIDPLVLLRDPEGSCVNGDEYGRPVNYLGRPIELTEFEYKQSGLYFNQDVESWAEGGDPSSLITKAQQARDSVANRSSAAAGMDNSSRSNKKYAAFEMFETYNGKRLFNTYAQTKNSQGQTTWELIRTEGLKYDWFPIIDRACYPLYNDWDGVSVSDMTEDKQRVKAMLMNLGLEAVVRSLYPRFVYNTNKISGAQLKDPKMIGFPTDGDPSNVIQELPTGNPNLQLFDYTQNTLKDATDRSTGTSDIQQGVEGRDKTATEADILATRGGVRYGLLAKILGISDAEYWKQWYAGHKAYMTDNDTKVISVMSDWGHGIREFSKNDFISEEDPDDLRIRVTSRTVSDTERIKALGNFSPYYQLMYNRENSNKEYLDTKLGRLMGYRKDELDMMRLPSAEQYHAEQENKLLNNEKMPTIKGSDDHGVHLFVHAQAADNNVTRAHRAAHFEALAMKRLRPELFPVQQREEAAANGQQPDQAQQQAQQRAAQGGVSQAPVNSGQQQRDITATQNAIQNS